MKERNIEPVYRVRPTPIPPDGRCAWDGPCWEESEILEVAAFRPESSAHRPVTHARLLYDDHALYGLFRVADRYVRSRHTRYQDPVCRDSCVECFLQPCPGRGYFNAEMNAGGTLLFSHVTDPTRTPQGFAGRKWIPEAWGRHVRVYSTLPRVVDPELKDPLQWLLEFHIPWEVLNAFVPLPSRREGAAWRANFYKCGDETSHPHWAAWAPVPALNFHMPAHFGCLEFA